MYITHINTSNACAEQHQLYIFFIKKFVHIYIICTIIYTLYMFMYMNNQLLE